MISDNEWIKTQNDSLTIQILVQPRASKSELIGTHDNRLKIRLKSPPVDGAANKELIAFLGKLCKVKKSQITITTGQSSRRKTVKIAGLEKAEIEKIFSILIA